MNELQYSESSLHILLADMPGRHRVSCQVLKRNLCLKYAYILNIFVNWTIMLYINVMIKTIQLRITIYIMSAKCLYLFK